MDEDGNLTNRHLVDQDDDEKLNLPDCNVDEDELDQLLILFIYDKEYYI